MTSRIALVLSAAALFAGTPAFGAASDFRLPPGSSTPTPRAQGPVDPDNPITRPSPGPTPTPTPAPSPAAPAATPSPAPRITLPSFTPTPRPTPTQRRTVTPPAAQPTLSQAAPPPAQPGETAAPLPTAFPTTLPLPGAAPSPISPAVQPADETSGLPWLWIALGLAVAGLAGAAWHFRRNFLPRRGTVMIVPDIEKPRVPVAPAPFPEPEPAAPAAPALPEEPTHPLLIAITPVKLTQTFMNEALAYRLTLTNVGAAPLGPIAVAADLGGAHASLSREEQLAHPGTDLPETHAIPGIAPGEQVELTGELRTPLASLPVMQQGAAALLVPLARFRVTAPGMEPRHFTLAVGQQVPGSAGLAPIRLDLGPRTTDGLAGRAF
ncbi:hypothetical protein [Tsuneonella sp. HG222]